MKRIVTISFCLILASILGAQGLKIGTIEGTSNFGPLVVEAFKEAGFDAAITAFREQGLLIQALAKGELDGAFFLAQPVINEVKSAVMVPVRLSVTNFNAVATDPSVKIGGPGDLRKYKVAIVKGHTGHQAVTRGMKTVEAENDIEEFKLLASGSVQAVIAVNEIIPIMCRATGIKDFIIQNPPLMKTPTFLALSRTQSGIKPKIEAVLKDWIESGKWEKEVAKLPPPSMK
jgi:ABC-type nitrate/sulfonate/bicarbonate transport system substrate-binding protein